ncbi:hypothetical protein S7711_09651 [Stachybotrys chartarum IBT 7711]|uniref:Uncharacterized protein n=1 Tax=Stachybotrys chartarum (strain CBS 109288 / IBT 7711) TaxID=1280523 RepID=A0A084AUY6_STACB|nr:hypothetical protein S7711_09651 [Stachybotrys chartarum IBT 7711]
MPMDITGFALVIGGGKCLAAYLLVPLKYGPDTTTRLGSGIGKGCALAFAAEGAAGIVVADINAEAAESTSKECMDVASNSRFLSQSLSVDITSMQGVENTVHEASRILGGRIDYCVNCAGIGASQGRDIAEADPEDFDRFMRVNVTGTFNVTRAVSALMKLQDPQPVSKHLDRGITRGTIVNMGSAASYVATPGVTPYTTAKHAVLGLTKNAAADNVALGIRVNCLCPTWVNTPMVRKAMEGMPELEPMMKAVLPMKRLALVEEVADAALFLCSPRSSYITGSGLILDGGATMTCKI